MGNAIILGAGSDIAYSFVTASSYAALPSVAAEDTLGLITSLSVSRVNFCNELPTSGVSAGEVRIKVGSVAQNYINILSDPLVRVSPISVYRYSGVSWVMIEAYVRRSSAWSIIRAEFYNNGAVGMIGSLVGYRYSTLSSSFTLGASNFTISVLDTSPAGNFVCVYGDSAIDVTNYTRIKISYSRTRIDFTGSHKARVYLNPTLLTGANAGFSEGVAAADIPVGSGTVELDVSGIGGFQMIHVALGRSSYSETDVITVTKIYGE